jgi:hypothetical protein
VVTSEWQAAAAGAPLDVCDFQQRMASSRAVLWTWTGSDMDLWEFAVSPACGTDLVPQLHQGAKQMLYAGTDVMEFLKPAGMKTEGMKPIAVAHETETL